jgi:NAD(P)-dependent dehydrogenase (short-subunit alcohol dehydrogenase family)
MSYQNKVVFVAGGTSGINLAIAEAFADDGAKVAVLSRKQDKVDAAVANLKARGVEAIGFAADVRSYEAVAAAFAATAAAFGPIDVLISGAAGNFPAPAAALSPNGFKSVMDIDLLGTFHVMKASFEHLRKPGATIINITAPQAWLPTPFQIHVCAAKAGVDQITRTLAMEWGPLGVRINAIAPGPIADTEGMARLAPDARAHELTLKSVPLGRYGQKSEIAKAALWLCSDDAAYVSGVVLPVDGGWSLGGSSSMAAAFGS